MVIKSWNNCSNLCIVLGNKGYCREISSYSRFQIISFDRKIPFKTIVVYSIDNRSNNFYYDLNCSILIYKA